MLLVIFTSVSAHGNSCCVIMLKLSCYGTNSTKGLKRERVDDEEDER